MVVGMRFPKSLQGAFKNTAIERQTIAKPHRWFSLVRLVAGVLAGATRQVSSGYPLVRLQPG